MLRLCSLATGALLLLAVHTHSSASIGYPVIVDLSEDITATFDRDLQFVANHVTDLGGYVTYSKEFIISPTGISEINATVDFSGETPLARPMSFILVAQLEPTVFDDGTTTVISPPTANIDIKDLATNWNHYNYLDTILSSKTRHLDIKLIFSDYVAGINSNGADPGILRLHVAYRIPPVPEPAVSLYAVAGLLLVSQVLIQRRVPTSCQRRPALPKLRGRLR